MTMKNRYDLSIVVPSYNELKNLPRLINEYRSAKKNTKFQLVVVDNGSIDETFNYLSNLSSKKENAFIKIVKIDKNIGYGNGIHQGLLNCDGDVIGWSHADLQCSPFDIFRGYEIYKMFNNKNILLKGCRIGRDWKSLVLTYGLEFYSSIVLLKIFNDINGQPKIFHKNLLKELRNPPYGFSYDLYVQYKALKNNYKVHSFNVEFHQRDFGISKWAYSLFSKASTIWSFVKDIIKVRFGTIN